MNAKLAAKMLFTKWQFKRMMKAVKKANGSLSMNCDITCKGGSIHINFVGLGLEALEIGKHINVDVPIKDVRVDFSIPYTEIPRLLRETNE